MEMQESNLINAYFSETVTIKKQHAKHMKRIVLPIIRDILNQVNTLDNRFGDVSHTFHAGTAFQKLKVKRLDEFDFTVPVMSLENLHWILPNALTRRSPIPAQFQKQSDSPEDVLLHVTSDVGVKINNDMITGNYVISSLAREIFRKLLIRAIYDLRFQGFVTVSTEDRSPATLTIDLRHHSLGPASVDLMPMCPIVLPFEPWVTWPRPGRAWPSGKKIKEIRTIGLCVVAKKEMPWSMSFAKCEKALMAGIDADQGVRRKCHRIMKALLEDKWCPKDEEPILTSYYLKNVLFWECESHPYSGEWDGGAIAVRINSLLQSLLDFMRTHTLPLYFYPEVNLFKSQKPADLNRIAARVQKTIHDLRESKFP